MTAKHIYKVLFLSQGKIYELYAREVSQGSLFGFVELGGFIFGERSAIVVDPSEERLQAEFSGVTRTYVPMHAIIRIDEVEKEGTNKISPASTGDNVTPFPLPIYTPGNAPKKP
jgi:hypothetical protein